MINGHSKIQDSIHVRAIKNLEISPKKLWMTTFVIIILL
jgi:hypothetical protein